MKIRKIVTIIAMLVLICPLTPQFVSAEIYPGQIYEGGASIIYRNVTVYAPAVAITDQGYVGVISTITVTIQSNGSGRVFVDTLPLTEVDMQGSARLAVKVASALVENDENCDINPSSFDYFFVVRTSSPIIGGPSAGGIMTVATISLLENWALSNTTVMTGMINPDGSIGPIGGIIQKIDAANSVGASHFLVPYGQGTYTEMVTTTDIVNGIPRIVTRPVTRNVEDYAMNTYGMSVTEVEDINQALENFTGYRFFFNNNVNNLTTEDYINSMKPLATTLLDEAQQTYDNADLKLDNSSIPNKYPNYYKNDIAEYLDTSKERLKQSEEAYENETYYTSTSKSFQSLIYSRFVLYACDYWDPDYESFIEDLITEVKSIYENASIDAKSAEIKGYISLQTVGAAQRRASEAKQYLDSAESMYDNGLSFYSDILDFLYRLSFVVERSNSFGWWLNIGSFFNETGNLERSSIENLTLEYIEDAQQATIYSGILLQEIGSATTDSSNYLSNAEELLESARDDLEKGYPAAALFEALEATVRANLAIEIIGTEPEEKIELASENALNKITRSREQGIEPVLAVSYYEYAQSLTNESDFENALLYYKYSGMIAGVLGFTNSTIGTASSRYVGLPNIESSIPGNWLFILIIISIFSLIAGLGIGLIIGGISFRENKSKKEPQIYFNKKRPPKNTYFSGEDMPRSIKDYYKKNK